MSYSSINRVVLVGRLTRDPELRGLPSGQAVCALRVACNRRRRDADGEFHEQPGYFDVSAFGALAENIDRYLRRGSHVAIDGRLDWREWETPEQQRRQAVSIVADAVEFLDRAQERDVPDATGDCDDTSDCDATGDCDSSGGEDPEGATDIAAGPSAELVF